jgi:UDP-N-acetyl-D-glucosamine dehydrogenase
MADDAKRVSSQALIGAIEERRATVGILGLGYVGLPLALTFASRGFRVLGFDTDVAKVESLERGESYIAHLDGQALAVEVDSGRFSATSDESRLAEPDALLICVPTPLDDERRPNLSYVEQTAQAISRHLRPGQLVVLESTTYPGTTDGLLRQRLEQRGLVCGLDFFLAYSPEREDPGNPSFATHSIPKVIGGVDSGSGRVAKALYDAVVVETVAVSHARVAEASKLTENIFRAVNIALVNELKIVYDAMGIDVWEVLDAAATKPFGFMRFNPGPGWGGHCIPIDPFYLTWKAEQHGVTPRFIELAGEINVRMPGWVVDKLEAELDARGRPLAGSRVLLLGLAYKPNVADPRESPAFELLAELAERGAEVGYHDPHIEEAPRMRTWAELPPMRSAPLSPETLASQDAVLLVTDHRAVDYELVQRHAALIVDTRGVYPVGVKNVVRA